MKYMPFKGTWQNDVVYTPRGLARSFVLHFKPTGVGLDPAMGDGAFYDSMSGEKHWCEICRGSDFFDWKRHVDYVMTNPPWSLLRRFLVHGYEVADNVYYLAILGNCFTRARIADMEDAGFGIRELCMCRTPRVGGWPTSGLQLGMVHWKRGWRGGMSLTRLDEV